MIKELFDYCNTKDRLAGMRPAEYTPEVSSVLGVMADFFIIREKALKDENASLKEQLKELEKAANHWHDMYEVLEKTLKESNLRLSSRVRQISSALGTLENYVTQSVRRNRWKIVANICWEGKVAQSAIDRAIQQLKGE